MDDDFAERRKNPIAWFKKKPRARLPFLEDNLLPAAAAAYFGGEKQGLAEIGFRKTMMLVGATAFRAELETWIGQDAQGDNSGATNPGGAFHDRLKKHLPEMVTA
jgi:hypothetical protein